MIQRLSMTKVRFLWRTLLPVGLVLGSLSLRGQNPVEGLIKEQSEFPYSWVGIWKGELNIYRQRDLQQSLPMQLHILPLDTSGQYSWTIIYGSDLEAGRRSYVLKTVDATQGLYQIDERNSISMEAYLLDNKLFSRFSVMDNLLLSSTEWREGQLVFEIISGSLTPASRTGGANIGGEDIPPVDAFPVQVMQRAVLVRE